VTRKLMSASRIRFLVLSGACVLAACGSVVHKATRQFADNLTGAILNQDDPATVHDGVPSYLLLIDGIIEGDPENADALLAGAKLYGAYVGGFVDDPVRAQRMAARAYTYAKRALCLREKDLCAALDGPFDAFQIALEKSNRGDVETIYGFASAWAGRI
jgi:hypothetical protein